LEKLVEQWVVPNEWERRVQGLDDDKAPPISFSLDFRFDSPGLAMHPAEIMASANKLGMPYELSASPGVNIQVRGEGLPPELVSNKNVLTSFRVDAPKNQWSIDGFLPGQIETRGDDVILIPQYGAESADMDWSCPLTFSLRRGAAIKGQALDETMVQIDWTMTLNLPEMDCQEVWALVKPLRESSGRVLILSPPGSETEYVDISENCSARPLLELSPEVVDTIEKLTTLQQYLGNRILFPLAGLPDVIGNLLLSSTVSSETEARELWNKIEKSTENDFTRPTITILTFEGQESSRLQWRRFSWIHRGHRYPKTSVTFDESAPEDAGRSFTESMEDPSKAIAIQKPLRLSRIAAVEYMEQNPIDMGDVHLPWPWKLKDFFGRSVEEFRTLLVMEWKPVEERRWCRVSPVKCILAELTKSERWLQEGRHSSDAGDLPRAYLAAKEAHRCNPESPIVNMNVGWYAFLLKRIVEAKRYTEKYWSFNEENTRAIAGFNMCVFALEEMRSSDDGPEQAKGQFLEWLETTLDSFVDVPAKTKEQSVNAFIGDLEELFQDQPPTAVDVGGIIDALTKLRNISLTCNKCST
jgi:hypothetical protein